MIGADILLLSLIEEKTKFIFGYPGGATIPFHDRLPYHPKIKHIMPRNEQGAAMAADAYFRITGKPGVCLSTSGPGATNLVTGIANAYMDSVGMVAITCQVAKPLVGTDAFQEVDIVGIVQPIVKHSYFVEDANDIPRVIKEAFYLASTGRPRPVHIDIPVDVLKQKVEKFSYPKTVKIPGYGLPSLKAKNEDIKKAADLIKKSQRPVIIAGHGVAISKAEKELKKLAEKINTPVVTTLLGIGNLPETHELSFGMLGMHGMAYANYAVHNADLIIAAGIRFDDRITGKLDEFTREAQIIHIDIDRAELGKNAMADVPLLGDAKEILGQINKEVNSKKNQAWLAQIRQWKEKTELNIIKRETRLHETDDLTAYEIIQEIDKQTKGQATMVADVGQNQMWTAQHFKYSRPEQFLNSGGLGCMGYSLPAAIGAQFGNPQAQVWAIMGDGGFQMNMQELGVIMEYQLPIKIILFNNSYLGMVRQWQELFYQKNYVTTKMANPDFVAIAKAYGIEAYLVKNRAEIQEAIKKADQAKKPIFIECIIGNEDNVYPMVAPGTPLRDTIIKRKKI